MSSPHDPFPHTCPTTPPQSHRPCVAPWHLVQGSNCKSRGRLIHTAQSTVGSMRVSSAVVEQSPCHPPPHSCHHFGWRSVGRQQLQQTSNRSDNFRFALCARPWVGWGTPACHGTLPSRTSWGCSCVNFNWVAVVADLPAIPGGRPASFGARTPFPSTRHQCGNQQQPKRLLRSRGLRDVPGKKKIDGLRRLRRAERCAEKIAGLRRAERCAKYLKNNGVNSVICRFAGIKADFAPK